MPHTHPSPSRGGDLAFALCELEWMRSEIVAQLQCASLANLVALLRRGATVEIDSAEISRIEAAIELAEEFIGWAAQLAPVLTPTRVGRAAVEAAAVAALRDGIASAARATHAASWIRARVGVRALATALETDDAHQFWYVQVEHFLASFRGATASRADAVAGAAGVKQITFAQLTAGQVSALRAELLRIGAAG